MAMSMSVGMGLSRRGAKVITPDDIQQTGKIAEWRFEDGSGTTATDETGTYDIDLTEAPTPNTAWETFGISANSGAIETPSMTNVRTVVMLYRVEQGGTGFHYSGPAATNGGPIGTAISSADQAWIGQGFGVGTVPHRSDGAAAYWLVSGQWRLLFHEISAATTGFLTFGSRGNSTLNRFTTFEMAWGVVYNTTLTEAARSTIYKAARYIARERSFNLDFQDISAKADMLWLWGQSNADGRGLISDLSAEDQGRTYDDVFIRQDGTSASGGGWSGLVLGSNHNDNSTTQFGAEIPWANSREDNPTGRDLYILKCAEGGMYLAPTSDPNVSTSYSTEEPKSSTGFWRGVMEQYYYAIADALSSSVGLELKAFIAYQGEQDALQSSTADVWGTQFGLVVSEMEEHTGLSGFPVYVARIRDSAPPDATAYATVRAEQTSAVSTLGSRATLVDVDSYSFGDSLHLDATGMVSFADYIWDDLGL